MAYGADMPISRRKFVAGSSLFGLFKSEKQRGLEGPPHFSPAVAKVTLARAALVVESMKTGPRWEALPIAGAHAAAEALFAHFEETRFTDFLDQWLTQYRPPSQADAATAMRECGLTVSEEIVSRILTCDPAEVAGARQTQWASLQALLLRGFETALTRDRRKFVRVTWESPWPRIISIPRARASWQFSEEVHRLHAASRLAVGLGLMITAGDRNEAFPSSPEAARMSKGAAVAGVAVLGTGMAAFLITLHQKNWFDAVGEAGSKTYESMGAAKIQKSGRR
jgi:hypothetical protein